LIFEYVLIFLNFFLYFSDQGLAQGGPDMADDVDGSGSSSGIIVNPNLFELVFAAQDADARLNLAIGSRDLVLSDLIEALEKYGIPSVRSMNPMANVDILASTLGEEHPKVVSFRTKIGKTTDAINAGRRDLEDALIAADPTYAANAAEVKSLSSKLEKIDEDLLAIPLPANGRGRDLKDAAPELLEVRNELRNQISALLEQQHEIEDTILNLNPPTSSLVSEMVVPESVPKAGDLKKT
jgi:hypothetical protein